MSARDEALHQMLSFLETIRCSHLVVPATAASPSDIQRCSLPQWHEGACAPTSETMIEWADRWDPELATELRAIRDASPLLRFAWSS